MGRIGFAIIGFLVLLGCSQSEQTESEQSIGIALVDVVNSPEEDAEIRSLIDELVFAEGDADNQPVRNSGMKIYDVNGNEVKGTGDQTDTEDYQKRYNSCQNAFKKLTEKAISSFPVLIEHLNDERQSINFRNHHLGNSVGDACHWIIYYQLQDRPENYSEYGYQRLGRDGKGHPKPFWEGTPFDDAGGLKKWLESNKTLSYPEMQIKCLQWLLDRELAIGVPDADSYFLNVLPLEIRVLERRLEAGEEVRDKLDAKQTALQNRDESVVPRNLLPDK